VAYHDFQGITVLDGEKEQLVESLGDKNLLVLKSHGLLSCGRTIAEMFLNMAALQRSCEIQVSVDMTGKPVVPVSQEIADKTEQLLALQMQDMGGKPDGDLEFSAMQRLIDKYSALRRRSLSILIAGMV